MDETTTHEPHQPSDEMERARFKRSLRAMNVALSPYAFEVAYARAQTAAKRGIDPTPEHMKAIVDDVLASSEILQGVAESFR